MARITNNRRNSGPEPEKRRPRPAGRGNTPGVPDRTVRDEQDFDISAARRQGAARADAEPAAPAEIMPDGSRPEAPPAGEPVRPAQKFTVDAEDNAPRPRVRSTGDSGETPHTPEAGTREPSRRPVRDGEPPAPEPGETREPRRRPARDGEPFPPEPGETREPPRRPVRDGKPPAPEGTVQEPGPEPPPAPGGGRLRFTAQEQAANRPAESAKTAKARRKAEKVHGKLDKAHKKLPKKRKIRVHKHIDPETGKPKRRLVFEEEVKSQRAHLKGPVITRPVKLAVNAAVAYGHKKIYQVQDENVAVEATHKAETAVEGAGRLLWRRHKTAPYRKAAKLEHKAAKSDVKLLYRQAVDADPKLQSSALSRFMQKQKIKREYARAARQAKKAGEKAVDGVKVLVHAVKSHPVIAITVLVLGLLIIFIMTATSSCSTLAGGAMSGVLASSYVAEDGNIDGAELAYSEWETDLQMQVRDAETTYPGYDEYKYSVDDIGHNPFELMAYLSAKMQAFSYSEAIAELQSVFAEQYQLTFTEEVETRYNDPDDDNEDGDYEPYDYYILNVTLTSQPFAEVIAPRLDTDQRGHYSLLMITKGNRQYAAGPFDFDWIPYVSCYYGWRIHPITGELDNHRGVDIAVASGTEILAAHDGTVTTTDYDGDGYGNYLVLTGEEGVVTKYAHCEALLVSEGQTVKAGDVIARVGNTGSSTGPHLHFEVLKDGQYLNPLFFSVTNNTDGGAIPGSPGGPVIPDYPGEPMGDGSYAALLEEAQKHLGKPYVFGASGPDTFDCSGFVCYALNQSGVASVGRTNAQGLFNKCTPVSMENARPGDLIFFQGTYSTPNACSHIGIYLGNGQMIHAGNPVQYASINTSYWQEHFYAIGRLP